MRTKIKEKETVTLSLDEPVVKPKTRDWTVFLKKIPSGTIDVKIKDGKYEFYLLSLLPNGTFYRQPNVDSNSGFKLDKEGCIVESKVEYLS